MEFYQTDMWPNFVGEHFKKWVGKKFFIDLFYFMHMQFSNSSLGNSIKKKNKKIKKHCLFYNENNIIKKKANTALAPFPSVELQEAKKTILAIIN